MVDADAILEDRAERPALRFKRFLPYTPDRVWCALTDPDEQFAWHPTPGRFDSQAGGRVEYLDGGYVPGMPDGRVTDFDPPLVLGCTWNTDKVDTNHLRWELCARDGGCILALVHRFADRRAAARDAAGWHICLEAMRAALDGHPERPDFDAADGEPWNTLTKAYEQRFGGGRG